MKPRRETHHGGGQAVGSSHGANTLDDGLQNHHLALDLGGVPLGLLEAAK